MRADYTRALDLLAGTDLLTDEAHALEEAERCGYPVMLKSTAGGGGIEYPSTCSALNA